MSHTPIDHQMLENELRGVIDEIRGGYPLAFAFFACRLNFAQIPPEVLDRAKASRDVTDDEYQAWSAAYLVLPSAEREQVESFLNFFVGSPGEFLTFQIGEEVFGIDILCIQEIRSFEWPEKFEGSAPCLLGAISLHGDSIPVIDLRLLRGYADPAYNAFTVTIFAAPRDQRLSSVGLVVDAVSNVVEIKRWNIIQYSPAEEARFSVVIDGRKIQLFHLETAVTEALERGKASA